MRMETEKKIFYKLQHPAKTKVSELDDCLDFNMGVKYKEIPFIFFPTKIGSKTREFLLLFFYKIYPFCAKFFEKFIFIFFH